MIERARAKRAWEATLPPMDDPAGLAERERMMEQREIEVCGCVCVSGREATWSLVIRARKARGLITGRSGSFVRRRLRGCKSSASRSCSSS
jgi:hypothetical protein